MRLIIFIFFLLLSAASSSSAPTTANIGLDGSTGSFGVYDRASSPQFVPMGAIDSVNHNYQVFGATLPSKVIEISDYCDASEISTDITTCAQEAIDAASAVAGTSYGGSIVHFPAALAPYHLLGTLSITSSFVQLEGDTMQGTYIYCNNGTADCIVIGSTSGSQIRDVGIRRMGVWAPAGKTGGAGIHLQNVYRARVERVDLENMWRGIYNDATVGNTTDIALTDVRIVLDPSSTDAAIYWLGGSSSSHRSDVFALDNVTVEGKWAAGTGILWDGFAQTMVGSNVRMLHLAYGLRVKNTAQSTSYFPAFANFNDFEAEGFLTRAVSIEAGAEFKFTNSDIDNLSGNHGTTDDYAVAVLPDTGYSTTRSISISNSRIGNSQSSGLFNDAVGVWLSNVQFYATSLAGAGLHPTIAIGAHAAYGGLIGIVCEEYGAPQYPSPCISTTSGASKIYSSNIDVRGIASPAIVDSAGALTFNAYAGGFGTFSPATDGTPAGLRKDQAGETLFLVRNSAGPTSVAGFERTSYTSGAYCIDALNDNGGSPVWQNSCGSAVKAISTSLPIQSSAYQYVTPTTGSTITIGDQKDGVVINPAGTLASLTVVLPSCAGLYDGKRAGLSTSQAITALTVNATAGAVSNAPTSLAAGEAVAFRCIGSVPQWFKAP